MENYDFMPIYMRIGGTRWFLWNETEEWRAKNGEKTKRKCSHMKSAFEFPIIPHLDIDPFVQTKSDEI